LNLNCTLDDFRAQLDAIPKADRGDAATHLRGLLGTGPGGLPRGGPR
jgi:hypothetical protein